MEKIWDEWKLGGFGEWSMVNGQKSLAAIASGERDNGEKSILMVEIFI